MNLQYALLHSTIIVTCLILGTEIEFGTEPLLIGTNNQRVCRTVTALDDDISDGTRTFKIEIRSDDPADIIVPVNFSPDSIPIQVIDNDGECTHTHTHTHTHMH